MPKIKIKDWSGIHSNLDQNDMRLEAVRDSTNFKFKKGYAKFESRNLTEMTMPDISLDFPQDFSWETGIFCTLTNDPLNNVDDEEAWKKDCLVVVAKAADPGKAYGWNYHRLIYIKNLTDDDPWYELSFESNYASHPHTVRLTNHNGAGGFIKNNNEDTDSYMSTDIDGKTFFQLEKGTLKIYMPHDCFKLQWLKRKDYADDTWIEYDGWSLDRLVEPYNEARAYIKFQQETGEWSDSPAVGTYTTGEPGPPNVRCADERRLGIKFEVEGIDDESFNVDERTLDMTSPASRQPWNFKTNSFYGRYLFTYQFSDSETTEQIYPPGPKNSETWQFGVPAGSPSMDDGYWVTYQSKDSGSILVIPPSVHNLIKPSGTTWGAIATHGDWIVRALDPLYNGNMLDAYKLSKAIFDAQTWIYEGTSSTVGESGFMVATDKKYSIIATAILDEREEVIVETVHAEAILASPATKFALKIKRIYFAFNQNPRVTRIRFYHKVQDLDIDYMLHHEVDLLEGKKLPTGSFFMSEYSNGGMSLSGNIGYLVDWENLDKYDVLSGWKSFTTESGVSIGVTTHDTVNLYHSVVGGGNLLSDLVYDSTQLPITGISNIRALCNVNGKIGAFTDAKLYIISSSEALGQLVFGVDDTLDIGVKDFNDIASIQGGAIANTRNGIFVVDGFTSKLISEPINDIVKANYDTSKVYYNAFKHEVYYKPTSAEDLYRYRFEDEVWEKINATLTVGDAQGAGEKAEVEV